MMARYIADDGRQAQCARMLAGLTAAGSNVSHEWTAERKAYELGKGTIEARFVVSIAEWEKVDPEWWDYLNQRTVDRDVAAARALLESHGYQVERGPE